jgi:hypothetical protein
LAVEGNGIGSAAARPYTQRLRIRLPLFVSVVYSGLGYGGTYGATSGETVLAEVNHYGAASGRVEVSAVVKVENVLDHKSTSTAKNGYYS